MSGKSTPPPRDGLVRLWTPNITLRSSSAERAGESSTIMEGHYCVFNRWTEIDSWFEGNFMERLAPGSAKKTMRESRDNIKVLFQHGRDPQIGSKPLGPILDMREDDTGGYYEVELLDADYVRDTLLPGLRANLYGASFRFSVIKEEWNEEPKLSESNPKGIPERTIKEFRLSEFGPVTFPAYPEASAGVRSAEDMFCGTDDYILSGMGGVDPEIVRMAGEGASFQDLLARRLGSSTATGLTGQRHEDKAPERERIVVRDTTEAEGDEPHAEAEGDGVVTPVASPDSDEVVAPEVVEGVEGVTPETPAEVPAPPERSTKPVPGTLGAPDRDSTRRPAEQETPRSRRDAQPGPSPTPLRVNQTEPWRL